MNNTIRQILIVVALLGAAGWQYLNQGNANTGKNVPAQTAPANSAPSAKNQQDTISKIRAAADNPDAKFWTTVSGTVVKNLKDDNEGDRHQKFLVEISNDITLLVAHNIDIAPRAAVSPGDRVTIHGEYVWNNRGGVMHWTHHDPKGRKDGGWIDVGGKRYE